MLSKEGLKFVCDVSGRGDGGSVNKINCWL